MSTLSPIALPSAFLGAKPTAGGADELAKRGQIKQTAEAFEASFLSTMFQEMFAGVETSEPFGGGEAETQLRSFMTEAFAKQVARNGGVGVSDAVTREMLKLQGLE
jgi:peptidoglycan hydrolase FlgJ